MKEITIEEAKSIAEKYLKDISHCTEYTDAFWFSNEKGSLSFGGEDSPVVVLKEGGKVINSELYVFGGSGEIVRDLEL